MNHRFFIIYFVLFTIVSCDKEKPLVISAESFSEKDLPNCKSASCPEIAVNYFNVKGNEAVSKKINSEIEKFITTSLQIGEKTINAKNIAEAATHFIKTYRMHSAEFPDMAAAYFAEIDVSTIFKNNELLSVQLKQYKFTGGAHGYGTISFVNFDPQTGKIILEKDLFKDFGAFKRFAEQKFRETYKISENETINSTGFWFENDTFYLPETAGLTKKNIIFHYNPYDIASYAQGPIELKIPLAEAKQFLTISVN